MRDLTRPQLLIIAAAAIALMTAAVGIYGLLTGPSRPPVHTRPAAHPDARGGAVPSPVVAADPSTVVLPHADNPIAYARAITDALFDWDTSSGFMPSDYEAPVLADADPSGEETAGLIADVATYLPTNDQWLNLATMDVAQTISIKSAGVPADWQTIATNAHGELRPGTKAVTVTGMRHRTGVWNDQPASTTGAVSFTVFVACPPAFDRCHILRLSQLDNPLR